MIKRMFKIIILSPDNSRITQAEMRKYILDAVQTWGGQGCPGDEENEPDPFFEEIFEHQERVRVKSGGRPTKC